MTETFYSKKILFIIQFISGIVLLYFGISGYLKTSNKAVLLIGILFGVVSIFNILNLLPSVSSLTVTAKGILVKAFFRKTFVNWDEIESFENKKVFFQNKIAIHFQPTYGKKFLGVPIGKRRNNFTAVLPYQYNVKAEELQKRLEEMSNN